MTEGTEVKEKKTKPSARQYVGITLAEYKPGMEVDPEFAGVMFRRKVSEANQADTPEATQGRNGERMDLAAAKCKAFGVKPLGAVSAPAGGITKAVRDWVKAFAQAFAESGRKLDMNLLLNLVKIKTGQSLTQEQVSEILAG